METFLTSQGIFATCTALAGLLLFCLAPYLPSAFPPFMARMVGFFAVFAALTPLWVLSGTLLPSAVLGSICLLVMIIVHLRQTPRPAPLETEEHEPEKHEPRSNGVTVIVGDK